MDFIFLGSGFAAFWLLGAVGVGSASSPRQPVGGRGGLADPDFEALRNKNVQLLSVLTDDWVSKLIM